MLFNTYEFIFLFLPVTFLLFFLLGKYKKKWATGWLVAASFFFYGFWDYHFVPLLMFSILVNFFVGRKIEKNSRKCGWLFVGILFDLALLGYFKYTDFFLGTVYDLLGTGHYSLPHIVLPLGISFFTFTQMAYLVDAYRGETKNRSFLTYCEFVTIFPHLIAGPILEHKSMIPQFVHRNTFRLNWQNISCGLVIFIIGLFKKSVIADELSTWCAYTFSHVDSLTFLEAWIGALAYTFQLYFDFSGYSEMAIGLGLMFNLKFPVNFNSPYQATSMIDFWRRWHMTLGQWVKNYLYIPLGGNRQGQLKKMRNLFTSMLIIGLWHGAGWTYVIWGGIHGLLLVINHQWRRFGAHIPTSLAWGMTFLCVVFCWVIFRADNIRDALNIISTMLDIHTFALPNEKRYVQFFGDMGIPFIQWNMPKLLHQEIIIELLLLLIVTKFKSTLLLMKNFSPNWKWFIVILAMGIASLCQMNTYTEFLYFQF